MSSILTDELMVFDGQNWPNYRQRSILCGCTETILTAMAWFVGTVVGTARWHLLPNPEIFGLDFALVGCSSEFLLPANSDCRQFLSATCSDYLSSCCAVSFFALDSGVSESLAVLFTATLLGCCGSGFRWSVVSFISSYFLWFGDMDSPYGFLHLGQV